MIKPLGLGSSGNRQCCVEALVKFYLVFSDLAENQEKKRKTSVSRDLSVIRNVKIFFSNSRKKDNFLHSVEYWVLNLIPKV